MPRRPVFSGVVAYRGVMPAARVPGWPWPHALVNWVGPGVHDYDVEPRRERWRCVLPGSR
jgi:hypothetical protein